jgi:hypothetical protein
MLIVSALIALFAQAAQPDPGVQVLKRAVLGWCDDRAPIDGVPGDVAARLGERAARCAAFEKQYPIGPSRNEEDMVRAARLGYEGRLQAMARSDASAAARAYVGALKPCYEWEGFHDCPEREALFAERYHAEYPQSPFVDFLPLLAAHRWICAAEAYQYEERSGVPGSKGVGLAQARQRFESNLAVALTSRDPLVRFAAAALQRTPGCFGGG